MPDSELYRKGPDSGTAIDAKTFWFLALAFLFAIGLFALLYALLDSIELVKGALLAALSGAGFVAAIIWIALNRRSVYWKEFSQHCRDWRSAGRMAFPPWCFSPIPTMYYRAPQTMTAGIAVISIVDLICLYWIILFPLNLVQISLGVPASAPQICTGFALFVLYTLVWVYIAAKKKLIEETA